MYLSVGGITMFTLPYFLASFAAFADHAPKNSKKKLQVASYKVDRFLPKYKWLDKLNVKIILIYYKYTIKW